MKLIIGPFGCIFFCQRPRIHWWRKIRYSQSTSMLCSKLWLQCVADRYHLRCVNNLIKRPRTCYLPTYCLSWPHRILIRNVCWPPAATYYFISYVTVLKRRIWSSSFPHWVSHSLEQLIRFDYRSIVSGGKTKNGRELVSKVYLWFFYALNDLSNWDRDRE